MDPEYPRLSGRSGITELLHPQNNRKESPGGLSFLLS